MKRRALFFPVLFLLALLTTVSPAMAVPLDFSDWTPWGNVIIDSSSAYLFEDDSGTSSIEYWGFAVPQNPSVLSFNYHLTVAPGNEDYFDFCFGDPSTPLFSYGGLNQSEDPVVYYGSFSTSFDSVQGTGVDIIFALQWGWGDGGFESTLAITNLDLSELPVNPVPEPATMVLLGTGLMGLLAIKRSSKKAGK